MLHDPRIPFGREVDKTVHGHVSIWRGQLPSAPTAASIKGSITRKDATWSNAQPAGHKELAATVSRKSGRAGQGRFGRRHSSGSGSASAATARSAMTSRAEPPSLRALSSALGA